MRINRWPLVAVIELMLCCPLLEAQFLSRIQKKIVCPARQPGGLPTRPINTRSRGMPHSPAFRSDRNLDLFVNTADATYSLTVYSAGWYGGKGGRRFWGHKS